MAPTDYAKGYLITLSGVAIITPDTLLIRLAAADPFMLAAARGLMGGLMVLALSAPWYRPCGIGLAGRRASHRFGLAVISFSRHLSRIGRRDFVYSHRNV